MNDAPATDRKPPPAATLAQIAGGLIAGVASLGTLVLVMTWTSGEDLAALVPYLAVAAAVPVVLFGLGLVALGGRLGGLAPGKPPLWHRLVGWALMILNGLTLAVGVVLVIGSLARSGPGGVGAALELAPLVALQFAGAIVPIAFCVLAFLLGRLLTRPRP